ncbi:hypothetical protein EDB89DRAFT_1937706 [Lactarius sanguifluus]|nr:hypothetical protein EDB89DRAFT_1937706 [Lactarius sanguifluus]
MTTMIAARTASRFHSCCRRAMMSAWSARRSAAPQPQPSLHDSPPIVIPASNTPLHPDIASPQTAARPPPAPKVARPKPTIRAQKAALSLTPLAVERLRILMSRVRNKGCAGLSYHLEYVDRPAKFDEVVEQDGVKVIIDSKALFSIIGSEMHWHEDALSSKFEFKNPNT